jgi:hypothetical protein
MTVQPLSWPRVLEVVAGTLSPKLQLLWRRCLNAFRREMTRSRFLPNQQVDDGAGGPGPAVGCSTTPVPAGRTTAPRWTTYHTPRHEIIDAIPNERVCPRSSYTSREFGTS